MCLFSLCKLSVYVCVLLTIMVWGGQYVPADLKFQFNETSVSLSWVRPLCCTLHNAIRTACNILPNKAILTELGMRAVDLVYSVSARLFETNND